MEEGVVAVFIPIIMFLVTGLVLVTYFYLRSRERQLLIEKGLDAHSIKEFFEQKKDPDRMLKIGVVIASIGFGVGVGLMLEDLTGKEFYAPFSIITIAGLGFIAAHYLVKKSSGNQHQVI
jgi:F0F1-type ATP synthase assembly protein I